MRSAPLRVARTAPGVPLAAAALSALPAAAHTPGPGAPLSSIRVTGDARIAARPDRVQIDIGVLTQARLSHDAATANARARCRARCDPRRRRPDGKVLRVLNVEESSPRIVPLRARVACGSAEVATPLEAGTPDVAADVTLSVQVAPAAH